MHCHSAIAIYQSMPQPNPWLDEVKLYLRNEFYKQLDFESQQYSRTFPYARVEAAMKLVKRTHPYIYSMSWDIWGARRSRNDIANGRDLDSSTVKRTFDQFAKLLLNYLVHPELMPVLPPIDLRIRMDEEDKGVSIPQFHESGEVYTAADYFQEAGV